MYEWMKFKVNLKSILITILHEEVAPSPSKSQAHANWAQVSGFQIQATK